MIISFDDEPSPAEQPDEVVGPSVARRDLPPPLRRWAAGRMVRREPSAWGWVFARTRELDPRSSAAIMNGLLDEVDLIPMPARGLLVRAALDSSDHSVRRVGLELLAAKDGFDAAYARAIRDPNARSRAWAQAGMKTPPAGSPTSAQIRKGPARLLTQPWTISQHCSDRSRATRIRACHAPMELAEEVTWSLRSRRRTCGPGCSGGDCARLVRSFWLMPSRRLR